MAKKDEERRDAKKDDELDEEEHDEHEGDDEDEDEDEEEAVSAKPVASTRSAAERRRARPRPAEKDHDDHDDHDGHGSDDGYEDDDQYWWTPHAVMSGLVLVGILGFFGVFNKVAGSLMGRPAAPPVEASATPSAHADAKPPNPHAPPSPMGKDQAGPKEMFGAKHLLVMYKGSKRSPPNIERSKEEAKTRAEEAAKKAKAGGKFEELVKEYSDEPGAGARGGDLGKFPKGSMVPEFQAGLDKLKVGEISGVVESPFGFHVILRTQ